MNRALNSEEITPIEANKPKGYKGLSGFHKYWGKKPPETWGFLIENLTRRGDIVLDPFLGSGLIAKECLDLDRRFIGFDINPISVELTDLYLSPPTYDELSDAVDKIGKSLIPIAESLYALPENKVASHFLWDNGEITKVWIKKRNRRIPIDLSRSNLLKFENQRKYHPKHISNGLNLFDNSRINSKKSFSLDDLFTPRAMEIIDHILESKEDFSPPIKRAIELILTASLGQMSKMVFAVSRRGKNKGIESERVDIGSWVIGYWRPKLHFEVNAWNCFTNKANKLLKAIKDIDNNCDDCITDNVNEFFKKNKGTYVKVGDSEKLMKEIPDNTIKVILTDPPHGDRIPYLELSEMWNCILGYNPDYDNELVVSNAKERGMNLLKYNKKMSHIFIECSRVLEDDGIMAVIFNARSKSHWDSLHTLEDLSSLKYIGCYPMEYSARSVVQDNRKGGLKTDYVLIYIKNPHNKKTTRTTHVFNKLPDWSCAYPNKGKI